MHYILKKDFNRNLFTLHKICDFIVRFDEIKTEINPDHHFSDKIVNCNTIKKEETVATQRLL